MNNNPLRSSMAGGNVPSAMPIDRRRRTLRFEMREVLWEIIDSYGIEITRDVAVGPKVELVNVILLYEYGTLEP